MSLNHTRYTYIGKKSLMNHFHRLCSSTVVASQDKILKSNKGNIKIAFEGFLYTKKKTCENHIHLELVGPNVWSKLNRDHSHLPNENLVIAEKIKCNMKQQAKINSKLPGQIFSETVINQPKEILYQLPCENSIKRTLRNQRTGNHQNDSNCDDLKTLKVEGEWALYHNENLLLHDNGTDAEERILVFGTDNELQLLVDADT
ncbi:Uncharacterized protein FWK35_00031042, partial [Aphis craccivora]